MNTLDLLRPARFPNEPREKYRERRRLAQKMVEAHLRGRLVHVSKSYTKRERKGIMDIVWSKGVTYRKPTGQVSLVA